MTDVYQDRDGWLRELFEERAAIMQYDGKMSKEAAERAAANEQIYQLQQGEL
jgi:hypothetical protein